MTPGAGGPHAPPRRVHLCEWVLSTNHTHACLCYETYACMYCVCRIIYRTVCTCVGAL